MSCTIEEWIEACNTESFNASRTPRGHCRGWSPAAIPAFPHPARRVENTHAAGVFAGGSRPMMETGGAVSHGSIVAREYGLPAVAGVAEATTRLHDSQRVRVDGQSGQVVLLDAEARTA